MKKKLTKLAAEAIDEAESFDLSPREQDIRKLLPDAHLAIIGFLASSPTITTDIGLENAIEHLKTKDLERLNKTMEDIFKPVQDINGYDFSDEHRNDLAEQAEKYINACDKEADNAADEVMREMQAFDVAKDILTDATTR